jgi:FAD/FMN-containing dehydrogenase
VTDPEKSPGPRGNDNAADNVSNHTDSNRVLLIVTHSSESPLARRAFLGIAAGSAAAVAVPGIASASIDRALTSSGIAARSAGPSPADWTALGHDLTGTLVRPGEAQYATAKLLFDPRFNNVDPAGVAYVKSTHDVATCLAFAKKFKIPFAARSGGHSYGGWSSTSGLIIDVSNFRMGPVSGSTAVVGTGTRLIDFYNGLASHGRAVPGGSCPTVGIAGLTLGGGIGVVARAYGLTCDSLESVQIVLANGSAVTATATNQYKDLFWASQGGGGGNFGVVTQFTFRTVPAPSLCTFSMNWPWSQAARVIAAWQNWAPHAPDQLWSNMHLAAAPGGTTPSIGVGGTYIGSAADAAKQIDALWAKSGKPAPGHWSLSNPQSFFSVMLAEAGCSNYQACHLPWYASGGTLSQQPQYAKSDFFTTPLSSSGINTLLAGVAALQKVHGGTGAVGGIAFDSLGGAVNRVAPTATAFVHRNALFSAQYTTDWKNGTGGSGPANQLTWLRNFWGSMRPYASGQAYQNYPDPDLKNYLQAYYGANLSTLESIKAKYDPGYVFKFPQSIPPAKATEVPVTG